MPPQSNASTAPALRGRERLSLLGAVLGAAFAAASCAGLADGNVSQKTPAAPGAQANAGPGRAATNAGPLRADAPPGRVALPDTVMGAEIRALDGRPFRLSDFGGKVIVLNLWATWCGPCRLEIPHLVEMNREYKSRGVEFVGLTTEDPATSEQKVREFAREYRIDYRVGFSGAPLALALMQNRTNIPQLFIIRDGQVFYHFIGFNPQVSPPRLREALEATLKAGA